MNLNAPRRKENLDKIQFHNRAIEFTTSELSCKDSRMTCKSIIFHRNKSRTEEETKAYPPVNV